jgi:hypothetical protein
VNEKARSLIRPVLGASKADRLVEQVNNLEKLPRVSSLRDCSWPETGRHPPLVVR